MQANAGILALAGIGAATILFTAYSAFNFLTFHLLTPAHPLRAYKRPGPSPTYALVTGASAGIGLGIAQELVRQGFGVILLGHLPDELAAAAADLRERHPGASVRTLVMNAQTTTADELQAAVAALASEESLQISILVNNVGGNPIALPAFRTLDTYSTADVDAVVAMNARFMARLTAIMLPVLQRRSEPRDSAAERSLVLSMSSAAYVGMPWLVMYSATKAFTLGFSAALARELAADPRTRHVDCLAVWPGEVRSQGNSEGLAKGTIRWDEYGRRLVARVDGAVRAGKRDFSPHWAHDLQMRVLALLPESARTTGVTDMLAKKRDAFNSVWEKSR